MTKAAESYIAYDSDGNVRSFVGPDAVALHKAVMIRSAIRMHKKSGILLRADITITKLLKIATGFTSNPYKRTESDKAITDLTLWIAVMKAKIPRVVQE